MSENYLPRPGIAGAAGCCDLCPKPLVVHYVSGNESVGKFCATHNVEYLEAKTDVAPAILNHARQMAGAQ